MSAIRHRLCVWASGGCVWGSRGPDRPPGRDPIRDVPLTTGRDAPPNASYRPQRTIKSIAGRGIQGVVPATIGRVRALELGSYRLQGIPTSFLAPGTNPGLGREVMSGNVGSLVWRRFRILLDYRAKKMYLAANASFGRPIPFNMAGLVLEQDRDDMYFARHVIENSPASESGIQAGDRITAVNGTDVREYSYDAVLDIFGAVGRVVKLTLERNGRGFERTIKLRRLT